MAEENGSVIDLRRLRRSCAECSLRTLCLPAGISGRDLNSLDRVVRSRMPLRVGESLFRAGDSFESLYIVRGGCLRTTQRSGDGDEQVIGFHLPGEVVGLDAISEGCHHCDATALERTSVCAVPFDDLERTAGEVPGLQHQLLRIISREMFQDQQHLVALGRRTARERLAMFLLSLSRRLEAAGYHGDAFRLPMSREDIAGYLGLALETISRLFGRMAAEGVIEIDRRNLRLLDSDRLEAIAGDAEAPRTGSGLGSDRSGT